MIKGLKNLRGIPAAYCFLASEHDLRARHTHTECEADAKGRLRMMNPRTNPLANEMNLFICQMEGLEMARR